MQCEKIGTSMLAYYISDVVFKSILGLLRGKSTM